MNNWVNIVDYTYDLPQESIALFPLAQRDQSKLLVYQKEKISHFQFHQLDQFLPSGSILFFNDTKVIPARLIFHKDTGAEIEIFLLAPVKPSPWVAEAMNATAFAQWQVTIGNAKRWPHANNLVKTVGSVELSATLVESEKSIVAFNWTPAHLTFAEVLSIAGATPLPPYLKRKTEASDRLRYQTIYSQNEGAVAAPTAGLHFTDQVFTALHAKNIATDFVTLHVSAGTFLPVKVSNALEHRMHAEQIVISKTNLENLLVPNRTLICVGTTSLRTLESLYWYGVKLQDNPEAKFNIVQEDIACYSAMEFLSKEAAFTNVLQKMNRDEATLLHGETAIYIVPGYSFKTCDALITNFHQPRSTLMLLVAAFIGDDWKKIYRAAVEKNYRFLSYGDSSLLFRK